LVGWIKQSDSDHSKKLDSFFKSQRQENSTLAITLPVASASTAPSGAIIVPVQFAGRAAIVSAVLNRTLGAKLILDTGATSTVISRRVANLLSMRPTGTAMGQTVGGMITAPIARLASLKVGAAEIAELSVIVHDFARDARIDGLLGMDFLGQYHVGLDSQRHLLVLSPR
ncbi:MAG: retropepsin-like aspartic protease family protein, partial [Candidatus Binatia bacterium]